MINLKYPMKELSELLIIKDHHHKMEEVDLKYIKMDGGQFVTPNSMLKVLKLFVNKWDMMMDL